MGGALPNGCDGFSNGGMGNALLCAGVPALPGYEACPRGVPGIDACAMGVLGTEGCAMGVLATEVYCEWQGVPGIDAG